MALPFSEKWDRIDYSFRAEEGTPGHTAGSRLFSDVEYALVAESFIQYDNVVVEDGFVYLNALTSSKSSPVKQVSSVVISAEIPGGIPENFTLEFDVYLQDAALPKSFKDTENRLFVGAINLQGYAAGFLFSNDGIALASHPEDEAPTILGGSKDLIFNADGSVVAGLFVRAIVNGEDGRIFIYTAPSESAYRAASPEETDAVIKYSLPAKKAGGSHNDAVILHASGKSAAQQLFDKPELGEAVGQDTAFALGSLRLCGQKVQPVERPSAVAYATVPQSAVNTAVKLYGSKSYDPFGRDLTYMWEIDVAPAGSKTRLQGAKNASTILTREEEDGTVSELVTITFEEPTSRYNDYIVEVTVGAANSLLTMELDNEEKKLSIVLGADSDGVANVTGAMLVNAFFNSKSAGHSYEVSGGEVYEYDPDTESGKRIAKTYNRILRASLTIPESSGLDLVQPGTFSFSGGAGSSLADPLIITDTPGQYLLSLVVNNTVRDSDKTFVPLTATITDQLLGHRPNSDYIFKYLPDFWKLVKEKEHLTAYWSAITQVVSSEMVSCWQNDYAKSLKDIARNYQRRWLHYDTHEEIPVDEPVTLVSQITTDIDNLVVSTPLAGTHSSVATSSAAEVDQPLYEGLAVIYSDVGTPEIAEIVAATYDSGWTFTLSTASFPVYRLVDDRTGGYFVRDLDDITPTTPLTSTVLYDPTYTLSLVTDQDRIRITHEDGTEEVTQVVGRNVGGVNNTVRLSLEDPQAVNGVARYWEHLNTVSYLRVEQIPYIQLNSLTSLSYSYSLGDYAVFLVIDPYTSAEVEIPLPIIALEEGNLFVDWSTLTQTLSEMASINGVIANWTNDDLGSVNMRLLKLCMHNRTHTREHLKHIPQLGTDTVNNVGVYKERLDYTITDGTIEFAPLLSGTCTVKNGEVIVEPGFDSHLLMQDFVSSVSVIDPEGAIKAGAITIVLEDGPAGTYKIFGYDTSSKGFVVDLEMETELTNVSFHIPRVTPYQPGPDTYWAEVSYFDNSGVVEDNFGLYVGFPKALVDEYDPTLDYLSVIKSMWFALLSGPHFDNLKLAVQALFNLPYTEQSGRVLFAREATSTEEGRLIFRDEEGREHVYVLPVGASMAINPRTGRTIKGFAYTDDVDSLTDEQKETREDSILDSHVKLVDVVSIDDYISNQDLINKQFGGDAFSYVDDDGVVHAVDVEPTIIEKYHTFLVNVPLEITNNTSVFPLVRKFLEEAKPAYTNFILVGSLNFVDEVSVIEEAILHPTILLKDTPHTSPFFARYDGKGKEYTAIVPALDVDGSPMLDPETGLPAWAEMTVEQAIVTTEREARLWPERKSLERVAVIDETPLSGMTKVPVRYRRLDDASVFASLLTSFVGTPPGDYVFTSKGTPEDVTDDALSLADFYLATGNDHYIEIRKEDLPIDLFTEGLGYREYNTDTGVYTYFPSDLFYSVTGSKLGATDLWPDITTIESFDPVGLVRIKNTPHFVKTGFYKDGYIVTYSAEYVMDADGVTRRHPIESVGLFPRATKPATYTTEEGEASLGSLIPFYRDTDESTMADFFFFHGDRDGDNVHDALNADSSAKTIEHLPDPEITYWDSTDVYEKYESGYCEGVLDDWSGDGSWNYKRKVVDMVNSWNSDIDVVMSKLWLPIQKQVDTDEDPEFITGELVDIKYYADGLGGALYDVVGHIWNDSPPTVEHVGAGTHPKIPFGTTSPQNAHPNTYLRLGFEASYDISREALVQTEEEAGTSLVNNYGKEERLNWWDGLKSALVDMGELDEADPVVANRIRIVGRTSGATASIFTDAIPGFADQFSIDDEVTKELYDLQTIWQQDKLIENGPASDPEFIITKYVPLGGLTINAFRLSSFCFNPGGGWTDDPSKPPALTPELPFSDKSYALWSYSDHDDDGLISGVDAELVHHTGAEVTSQQAERYNLEVQVLPPNLSVDSAAQMVPSLSPGFYSWWNNVPVPTPVDGVGSGITPASEVEPLLVWGYKDEGFLEAGVNEVLVTDWEPPGGVSALQNVHVGMKVKARKTRHLTHGFTEFVIPPPSIKMVVPSSSGYDVRVCGFYFCNDDPTRTELPTKESFDGSIGGSWIFMRNCLTGEEIQVTDWSFETGVHPGKHIVPKGPTREGRSTWVVGREADPADPFDNGQTSDGHVIEFNIPTLDEEGYYDIIVRNYRPWYFGSDTSDDKRNIHIDTVIASRAYYYSTEGFGGAAWGTSSWGSAE